MKNIKEDLNHWREILCSWMRELDAVQMPVLTNNLLVQCNSNENPKNTLGYLAN